MTEQVIATETPIPTGSPLGTAVVNDATQDHPSNPTGAVDDQSPKDPVTEPEKQPDAKPALTVESYQGITLPEGVQIDDAQMSQFKETAAKSGLSPEGAQSLIEQYAGQMKIQADSYAKAQEEAWTKTIDEWKGTLKADPEIGGDKMPQVQATIARALDEYGSPATRAAFDLTGAGWNPEIIRFVHKLASVASEGTHVQGNPADSNQAKTLGQLFYPDSAN